MIAGWHWIYKLRCDFLFGDYDQALAAGDRALPLLWASAAFIPSRDFCLYYCLALAASFEGGSAQQQETWLSQILTHQAPIRRWAALNPHTFGQVDALVAAEIARITGQPQEAMRQYEESIKCARRGRFIQDEALACELAARFYQAQGLSLVAELHWREACACYAQWGAQAKVRQLKALHPQLEQAPGAAAGTSIAQLDALSVIKASQAISGLIVLDELLDTLMRTLLENAGAQQGYLMLAQESGLSLAAEARVDSQKVRVRLHHLDDMPVSVLPESIINYVRHGRE
jgi:tetratricopeptide (TPR) repeat protein